VAGLAGLETLRIASNGISLHAVAAGPPDGRLVVLLHGFPEFWYGWRKQIVPLSESGLRVVAPDLRGYNLSTKPKGIESYVLDVLTDDVLSFAEALGRHRFAVVGPRLGRRPRLASRGA
jgi:pimeloyl-ACP methyl ester carboxylesterase